MSSRLCKQLVQPGQGGADTSADTHTCAHTHADTHTRVHTLGPASPGREMQQEPLSPSPPQQGGSPHPAPTSPPGQILLQPGQARGWASSWQQAEPWLCWQSRGGTGDSWGQGWGRGASTWERVLPRTLYQPDGVGWMWGPAQPRGPISHLLQPTQWCCPISGATSGPAGSAGSPPRPAGPPSSCPSARPGQCLHQAQIFGSCGRAWRINHRAGSAVGAGRLRPL